MRAGSRAPSSAPARSFVRRDSSCRLPLVTARGAPWPKKKSVKRADRPDSVQTRDLAIAARGRHSSGPGIAARLGATYPPARAGPHFEASAEAPTRAGLFGIAARRDCPFHPAPPRDRADSSLLLWSSHRGGQPLAATPPCAVRTFLAHRRSGARDGLARFTPTLSTPAGRCCAGARPGPRAAEERTMAVRMPARGALQP